VSLLQLDIWRRKPTTTEVQTKPPVVKAEVVKEVVVAKPTPPPQVVETMVKPFYVRTIDHDVSVEQIGYHVHVHDFTWLCMGCSTHAEVIISRPKVWEVRSQGNLMLTHSGRAHDCVDQMIGAFAQVGLAVNRRLIDACLFPIQNQILEVERRLKSFA
jgi:hypothetical protein